MVLMVRAWSRDNVLKSEAISGIVQCFCFKAVSEIVQCFLFIKQKVFVLDKGPLIEYQW